MRKSFYSFASEIPENNERGKPLNAEEMDCETFFEKFEILFNWNFKNTGIKVESKNPTPISDRRSGKISSQKYYNNMNKEIGSFCEDENKENLPSNMQIMNNYDNDSSYSENLKKLMRQTSKEYFQQEKRVSKNSLSILYELAKKKSPNSNIPSTKSGKEPNRSSQKKLKSKVSVNTINRKVETQIMKSISNLKDAAKVPKSTISSKNSFFESAREKLAEKIAKVKEAKKKSETTKSTNKYINEGSTYMDSLKGKSQIITKNRSVSSFNFSSSFQREPAKPLLQDPSSKSKEIIHHRSQRSTTFNSKSFR